MDRKLALSQAGEIWKRHPVFLHYYGSSFGRVWRDPKIVLQWNGHAIIQRRLPGKLISPSISTGGYRVMTVAHHGQKRVSNFLLECFIGSPRGYHACHNNGQRDDDRIENLRWDTPSANMQDKVLHGTQHRMYGEKNPLTKINEHDVLAIRWTTGTLEEIAQRYGVSAAQISRIKRYKSRAMK